MKHIKRVIPTESLKFSFSRHGKYDIDVDRFARACDDNSERRFSDILSEKYENNVKKVIKK